MFWPNNYKYYTKYNKEKGVILCEEPQGVSGKWEEILLSELKEKIN